MKKRGLTEAQAWREISRAYLAPASLLCGGERELTRTGLCSAASGLYYYGERISHETRNAMLRRVQVNMDGYGYAYGDIACVTERDARGMAAEWFALEALSGVAPGGTED